MVIMDNYYAQDRLREIWQKIDKYHLGYLEMEESPEKMEHRIKLEDYIRDFLCMASHNQKFFFQETAEVLQRSASSKKDFSGYKAATGFNAIQLYAANLLTQSWRKEYRQIKTYCGFYKHQIEANLVGAEIMFEAMGYKHAGDGVLVLDGPICPDKVSNVSKDCLVAYVECQILKAIWEEISASFNITWLDVLDFRKTHLCSPEQSIKALKYRQHQRQYQEHNRTLSQGAEPFSSVMPQRCQTMLAQNALPMNHSFPPLSNHHHLPAQPVYNTNGCCGNNCGSCGGNYAYMPYPPQPILKPQFSTNGYYYTNGFAPVSTYSYPVPTAQLIELEPQHGYDMVDGGRASHSKRREPEVHAEAYRTNNKNNEVTIRRVVERESDKDDSQFEGEDWDYVYRNLESQGYSKDLGERGDLLSPSGSGRRKDSNRKIKITNLDEPMNHLQVSDRPLRMAEALEKLERDKRKTAPVERKHSQSSSYENLSGDAPSKSKQPQAKTLPRDKVTVIEVKPSSSKTLDLRNKPKDRVEMLQCKACTYLNDPSKDICEICSKSLKALDDQPIEVGGAECGNCTLVNRKNMKICQACGASLKDSPTYI